MIEQRNTSLKSYLLRRRFFFLLILLVFMIVITPFLEDFSGFRFIVDIVVSAILIAAIFAISDKKHKMILALFLVVPRIGVLWGEYFVHFEPASVVGEILEILFYGFAISQIVNFIRKEKEVTTEVIYAAVVVYLLIAALWADLYKLLETQVPGSFSLPEGQIKNDRLVFLYFSIVTITTLGYGDITPLTDRAGGLAAVEAFTGQIYLVVLVAWLVGMHVSRKSK